MDTIIAVTLALLALGLCVWMAWTVTERIAHVEDEIAYLFQARTYARGALWAPSPPDEAAFFTPFTVIVGDRWISKYTIGWPMLLALGSLVDVEWLVNPLLGAVLVGMIYRIGSELYDRQIGLMAGLLTATSPFFLIQSSTYMSHAASALWATLLMWAWLRLDDAYRDNKPATSWSIGGGAALGMLAITRPLTAVGAALPFGAALVVRAARGRAWGRLARIYGPLVASATVIMALQPLYLWVVTGNPTTNLYTLVWEYDRIGFGPGIGVEGRHTLARALESAGQDLLRWTSDLFGWPGNSFWPLLPGLGFAVREAQKERKAWVLLLAGPFVALVIVHLAYWVGSQVYGPRYYYEGMAGLAILAALGLRGTVRVALRLFDASGARVRLRLPDGGGLLSGKGWPAYLLLAGLIAVNVGGYLLPERIPEWQGLYGITRQPLDELDEIRESDHLLVLVKGDRWVHYGPFMMLNSPWLDGPVIAGHYDVPGRVPVILERVPTRDVLYYDAGDGTFSDEPGY